MDDHLEKATEVVRRLVKAGHVAYFAGGFVRDHVMGIASHDIDIATSALPQQVLDLFPRTLLVGLSFGVILVMVEGHQFEVATFRRDLGYADGRRPDEVEFSSAEEDAKRRDFTINGMFYDPIEHVIHDYVNGVEDINKRIVRTIGDPDERLREDRLRMMRAIRFAMRFGFNLDEDLREAIRGNAETLFPAVAMERIFQEFQKIALYPSFDAALIEMHRLGLLQVIFPKLQHVGLHEIEKRVAIFKKFPKGFPTIVYLMELFGDSTAEEQEDLCRYLKASNRDIKLVRYLFKARALKEPIDWVHFYADPNAEIGMRVLAARSDEKELLRQRLLQAELRPYILRVQNKQPLVTALLLQKEGVSPGPLLGDLLEEAERLAVKERLLDAESVIAKLKQSPLWPKT